MNAPLRISFLPSHISKSQEQPQPSRNPYRTIYLKSQTTIEHGLNGKGVDINSQGERSIKVPT
jgi:hypothetical protein